MKGFTNLGEDDIEKAKSGVYTDDAENRKKSRVGQHYGADGKPIKSGDKKPAKGDDEAPVEKTLDDHAKNTDSEILKKVIANSKSDPELIAAAKRELTSRGETHAHNENADEKETDKKPVRNDEEDDKKQRSSMDKLSFDNKITVINKQLSEKGLKNLVFKKEGRGIYLNDESKLKGYDNYTFAYYDKNNEEGEKEGFCIQDVANDKEIAVGLKLDNFVNKFNNLKNSPEADDKTVKELFKINESHEIKKILDGLNKQPYFKSMNDKEKLEIAKGVYKLNNENKKE